MTIFVNVLQDNAVYYIAYTKSTEGTIFLVTPIHFLITL